MSNCELCVRREAREGAWWGEGARHREWRLSPDSKEPFALWRKDENRYLFVQDKKKVKWA